MAPSEETANRAEVDHFIREKIDTVPHLEALLLFWQHSAERWTAGTVAKRLWIDAAEAGAILQDLAQLQLITPSGSDPGQYAYQPSPANDRMLRGIAGLYRQEMVRISRMIHAKPSSAVRAFARAFRFTKDKS